MGENGWAYTFTGLPVYWNHGELIDYSLKEIVVDDYMDEIVKGEDGYTFTVTNIHVPAMTDVVVKKIWDDADNQDGVRPERIHVVLSGSDGFSYDADLTEQNGYVYVFTDLPVFCRQGEMIVYTLAEDEVKHYESEIAADESGYLFTVINTHMPETREIKVKKVWEDSDNKDGLRRDVSLILRGSDGSAYWGVIARDAVKQEYTFTDLPVYAHGEKITYELQEEPMDGYVSAIEETKDGFTVMNFHTPETEPEPKGGTDIPTVTPGDNPKTGDDSNIALWLALAGLGLLGVMVSCGLLLRKRKA